MLGCASIVRRTLSCRDAIGTAAPVDDLGFIDLVAGVVGSGQARGGTDRAVDVDHPSAGSADQMMMVVADPVFETGWRASGLDAPDEALVGQGPERVVHRLAGDGADFGPDDLGDVVRGTVGSARNRPQDGQALGGDLHAMSAKKAR